MYRVVKRDGKTVDFDLSKISTAITLAFDACERQYNQNIIDFMALKVTAAFEPKIKDDKVSVEDIQDSVESVLALSLIHIYARGVGRKAEPEDILHICRCLLCGLSMLLY